MKFNRQIIPQPKSGDRKSSSWFQFYLVLISDRSEWFYSVGFVDSETEFWAIDWSFCARWADAIDFVVTKSKSAIISSLHKSLPTNNAIPSGNVDTRQHRKVPEHNVHVLSKAHKVITSWKVQQFLPCDAMRCTVLVIVILLWRVFIGYNNQKCIL